MPAANRRTAAPPTGWRPDELENASPGEHELAELLTVLIGDYKEQLILEAKKGISSLQVGRHLGVKENNTKSTWFLCHRIREAATEAGFEFLTGTVEVDETYLTPRKPRKGEPKPKRKDEMVVLGVRQRGGPLRLIPVKSGRMEHVEPEMEKHIHPDALVQTDKATIYQIIFRRRFVNHRMIDHIRTYGEGENHTNTVERAHSRCSRKASTARSTRFR